MFDDCLALQKKLKYLQSICSVHIQLFTDKKTLFDDRSIGTRSSDQRLILDVAFAKERFKNVEISETDFNLATDNIAGHLTNPIRQAKLQVLLATIKLDIVV